MSMPSEERLVDDFWGTPLQAAPRLLDELLARSQRGVRLWAPAFVPLDVRTTLNVHAGVLAEASELERLAFLERAVVVAVDLANGEAHAVRVGVSGQDAPSRLPPPPGFEGGLGPSSGAVAAEVARCVLWDATTGAWRPGRYRLTAVVADRASNDVLVEVARSTSTIDPAVRQAGAADGGPRVWPPPHPAGGLPLYDSVEGSLSPPSDPGVVIAAERVVTAREGAACALHGAVRARPRDEHRARHGSVIPVTLVITGSESPGPSVVRLRVPSFDRDGAARADGLTARFAVDLFQLAPVARAPQTYFVYAFTADGRFGPVSLAVVAG